MKILILFKKWPGGVGAVVKNLKEGLKLKGHIVNVLSREEDLKLSSLRESIFPIRTKIKQTMKEEKYDIIYTQDWSLAFPLIFPFPIFKKKHFCLFHGNDLGLGKYFQNFVGFFMGKKLIVVGNLLKDQFPKSNLIYNSVDLKQFKRIKKIKRIKNSVGFANWKTKDYNYLKIKKIVEQMGKKFIIAENIPHKKMPEFYNKIECFISIPPKHTGFNLVWLEAMACNVPNIIGTNSGIGKQLPIEKVKDCEEIKKEVKNLEVKNYRKWLEKNKHRFGREENINKLINILNKYK